MGWRAKDRGRERAGKGKFVLLTGNLANPFFLHVSTVHLYRGLDRARINSQHTILT